MMGHSSANLVGFLLLLPNRVISGGASEVESSLKSSVSLSSTSWLVVGMNSSGGFVVPGIFGFLPRGFLDAAGGGSLVSSTAGLQFSQFQISSRGSPLALEPTRSSRRVLPSLLTISNGPSYWWPNGPGLARLIRTCVTFWRFSGIWAGLWP